MMLAGSACIGVVDCLAIFPAAAFLLTFLLVLWMVKVGHRLPQDHPNTRSLHLQPVPRTGGLAIMAASLLTGVFIPEMVLPLSLSAALMVVSFLDDLRGLPAAVRFVTHFAAAGIFTAVAFRSLPWAAMLILIIGLVWAINLFNFMDGSDGLAGGMALFGFAFYAWVASAAGYLSLASAAACVSAGAAAFLVFNFPPARIFMGDAGSIPLGFLAAAFGAVGWHNGVWPLWFPVLVFSPFIVDASVTLLKRCLRRERVWQAHRDHYYQRLVRSGLGHRNTALIEYAVMSACGLTALWGLQQPMFLQGVLIITWLIVYTTFAWDLSGLPRGFAFQQTKNKRA